MDIRTLIVGTVPYNTRGPSRAFESYFHGIDNEYLAQVFSNPAVPKKGHCKTLYQITDKKMLKRWLNHNEQVGKRYDIQNLDPMDSKTTKNCSKEGIVEKKLYRFGAKHSPAAHLMRKILWKKSYWATNEFNSWLDEFNPQCVFISFSDEFFILDIALYVANKYDIPIVFTISDDYVFNDKFSISPLYHLYRSMYKRAVRNLLAHSKYGVYICDKIKEKYNSEFQLKGDTVYLTSTMSRKDFRPINLDKPIIRYFGNVMLDRYLSLVDIGNALQRINENYYIEVYASGLPEGAEKVLNGCKGIRLMQPISYSEVCVKTNEADLLIVVEGFTDYNIRSTRYSLSTKAADSMASGTNVFAYGSIECGLIDYLAKNNSCMVCTNKDKLDAELKRYLNDMQLQRMYYNHSKEVYEKNHSIDVSSEKTQMMIWTAVNEWKK